MRVAKRRRKKIAKRCGGLLDCRHSKLQHGPLQPCERALVIVYRVALVLSSMRTSGCCPSLLGTRFYGQPFTVRNNEQQRVTLCTSARHLLWHHHSAMAHCKKMQPKEQAKTKKRGDKCRTPVTPHPCAIALVLSPICHPVG